MDCGVNQKQGRREQESLKREYLCLPTEEGFPARGGRMNSPPKSSTKTSSHYPAKLTLRKHIDYTQGPPFNIIPAWFFQS